MRQFIVFLSIVMVLAGCVTGSSVVQPGYNFARIDRVAVVEVAGANNNKLAQNEVSDLLAMELFKRGFRVVERTQVESILEEQDFQATDLTSDARAAQLGRILNVDAAVIINVPEMDGTISMTAKMIDVETGELLWMGESALRAGQGISTVTGALVGAAVGGVAGHQIDDDKGSVVGAIAGGVAGGVVGHALEPTTRDALRKVVAKIAEGMPSKLVQVYR
jgi:outer membrane lipoprotein SlyB